MPGETNAKKTYNNTHKNTQKMQVVYVHLSLLNFCFDICNMECRPVFKI